MLLKRYANFNLSCIVVTSFVSLQLPCFLLVRLKNSFWSVVQLRSRNTLINLWVAKNISFRFNRDGLTNSSNISTSDLYESKNLRFLTLISSSFLTFSWGIFFPLLGPHTSQTSRVTRSSKIKGGRKSGRKWIITNYWLGNPDFYYKSGFLWIKAGRLFNY